MEIADPGTALPRTADQKAFQSMIVLQKAELRPRHRLRFFALNIRILGVATRTRLEAGACEASSYLIDCVAVVLSGYFKVYFFSNSFQPGVDESPVNAERI